MASMYLIKVLGTLSPWLATWGGGGGGCPGPSLRTAEKGAHLEFFVVSDHKYSGYNYL